jgi:phosphotransferase system HPr-like phosphotransfer protein
MKNYIYAQSAISERPATEIIKEVINFTTDTTTSTKAEYDKTANAAEGGGSGSGSGGSSVD